MAINIDPAATPEQLASTELLLEVCPRCGTRTVGGFGLMGGGYGPYVICPRDPCGYFAKQYLPEDEA
jgi:hypothetical protein